nr:putative Biomphalaria glabrata probable G-protein coupled receptor 83 [Biomphalaria glabrata]
MFSTISMVRIFFTSSGLSFRTAFRSTWSLMSVPEVVGSRLILRLLQEDGVALLGMSLPSDLVCPLRRLPSFFR